MKNERVADQDDPNLQPLSEGEEVEAVSLSPVAPRLATMISVRFDPEHAVLLRRAARIKNMTQSAFVRQATMEAAEHCIHKETRLLLGWDDMKGTVPTIGLPEITEAPQSAVEPDAVGKLRDQTRSFLTAQTETGVAVTPAS